MLATIYISTKVIRYKTNQNEGHPSYDHGFKRNTFLVDLHKLCLRTDFLLDPSTIQCLLR